MRVESKECAPYQWIERWVGDEQEGALFGVLSTVDAHCKPYTRTIAIREINEKGVLFFTQKGSKKVQHIEGNPATSLTVYLPVNKRHITIRGNAKALTTEENNTYWKTYPKESQLRFLVYGPRSGEKISSNTSLDKDIDELKDRHQNSLPDRPESYVGYLICAQFFDFYQFNSDKLSDSFIVSSENGSWQISRVVP